MTPSEAGAGNGMGGATAVPVLVVDDDRALARALAINLRAHGYQVTVAGDGRSALDLVAHARPAVVILDLGLPDIDGLTVLEGIRGWSPVAVSPPGFRGGCF